MQYVANLAQKISKGLEYFPTLFEVKKYSFFILNPQSRVLLNTNAEYFEITEQSIILICYFSIQNLSNIVFVGSSGFTETD